MEQYEVTIEENGKNEKGNHLSTAFKLIGGYIAAKIIWNNVIQPKVDSAIDRLAQQIVDRASFNSGNNSN